jgi:hypothetical protein
MRQAPREQVPALGGREQRQVGDRPLGVGESRGEELAKVAQEALHGAGVEQVPGEFAPPVDVAAAVFELEVEVGLGGAGVNRGGGRLQAGQAGQRLDLVDQLEAGLEDRAAPRIAVRVEVGDHACERQVLARIGGQGGRADLLDQRAVRRAAAEVDAQRQVVDEEADEPLELGAQPAGAGHSDRQVLLAAVAPQQRGVGRHERHERCRAAAPRQVAQRAGERFGQRPGQGPAAKAALRGPRPVGRQLQRRQSGKAPAPPGCLLGERRIVLVRMLPGCIVGVVERQLGERSAAGGGALGRRAAARRGAVERRQLAPEDAGRPAVEDQVVHGQDEAVLERRQAHQEAARPSAAHQVEVPARLAPLQALGLGRAALALQPREIA